MRLRAGGGGEQIPATVVSMAGPVACDGCLLCCGPLRTLGSRCTASNCMGLCLLGTGSVTGCNGACKVAARRCSRVGSSDKKVVVTRDNRPVVAFDWCTKAATTIVKQSCYWLWANRWLRSRYSQWPCGGEADYGLRRFFLTPFQFAHGFAAPTDIIK